MKTTNLLVEKYVAELNKIRLDKNLIRKLDFSPSNTNHQERLRMNIALFHDFKASDFWIAKYLFEQENYWRKSDNYYDTGEVDNLYFSAFLVSKYRQPEMVLEFYKTKMIDFDCGVGFEFAILRAKIKEVGCESISIYQDESFSLRYDGHGLCQYEYYIPKEQKIQYKNYSKLSEKIFCGLNRSEIYCGYVIYDK